MAASPTISEPLQVRTLGGASPIQPTGRLICQDDFEDTTFKWFSTGDAGGTVSRDTSNQKPFSGAACMIITTAATTGFEYFAFRRFNLLQNKRIGFQCWFLASSLTSVNEIRFHIEEKSGSVRTSFAVKYLPASQKWQYLDSNGNYSDIPDGAYTRWHVDAHQHIKLVVDMENAKYVYLSIGDKMFDMRTLIGYREANVEAPHWYVAAAIETGENVAKSLYVDDVLITNYEP